MMNLQTILKEIMSLSRPQDMQKKIIELEHALSLVQRQSNPKLWAAIQVELGDSLCQNPQGNRADNLEKAIEHYNRALEVYTQKDFPVEWAETQNNLAIAYCNRIRGNKADNIEKAIEHYNQAFEVYTLQDFPVDWATTQNNLAKAYTSRIRGDQAENIEKAIEYYNQALKVRTQDDFPMDWARTQNNLANAYCDQIRGTRAENIEKAIEYFNEVLKVYTFQDFPLDWAMTQNNLGIAFSDRIRGNKAENFEKAIEHYNQALKVYTRKDLPEDWAMIQINLASAYVNRILGDRAGNIEQAIEHFNYALEVYTPKDFPVEWAETQNNLAAAYWSRLRGDRANNIEKAIEHYNQALEVRTQKDFPVDWAKTQNNLAAAYWSRVEGDRSENIEQAIEHYNQALEVRTRKNSSVDWATTQNNLANAYCQRIKGDRAKNIEKAIEHYNQALEVRTLKDFPVDWAMTQHNLANAYFYRILGDKAENIEKAISHYHSALEIYKLESMPNEFRKTCRLLGDLYLDMEQWEDAAKSYKDAIKAGNLLYRSGLSAESKAVEVGENASIYKNSCLAACRMGLTEEALLILEGGKTRLLSEALSLRIKQLKGVPNEEWIRYEQAAEKYRTATKPSDHKNDYAQREKEVQRALEELDAKIDVIQSYNPEFQKELEIADILSTLDKETALLTFCITEKGSIGLVVTESSGIQSMDIPSFKKEDLNWLLFKSDEQGIIRSGWIGDYLSYLKSLGSNRREETFNTWKNTLSNVLSSIGIRLLNPLLANLPPQIKRLIILPSDDLFVLPLHAVPLSDDQLLCQRYRISYAPSIQLLKEMQNKAGVVEGKGLYAVNPQEDPSLVFSGYEVQTISKLFNSSQVNMGETGTKATVLDRVSGRAYIHFSCHGSFNWNDPPKSGLYLVGGRTLSLADLQNDVVDLSSARLVTLSACETGITDILKSNSDEFVGLPAGFMLAGVPCVVSSLWSVPDISTAILMERFYSNHIVGEMDILLALQDAQLWVRDLTANQVVDYVEKCYKSGKWNGKSKEVVEQYREHYLKMAEEFPNEKPFKHPYYWAAFTVNGA